MERLGGFVLIAAALAVGAPQALAEGAGGQGGRMFQHLDLNRDDAVTPDEAGAVRTVQFLRWDSDGDGVIAEAEMLAAAQAHLARRIAKKFARMDRNGDGRVERAEFDDTGAARLARLDTDGDGQVSREEIRAYRHDRRRGRHNDLFPDG